MPASGHYAIRTLRVGCSSAEGFESFFHAAHSGCSGQAEYLSGLTVAQRPAHGTRHPLSGVTANWSSGVAVNSPPHDFGQIGTSGGRKLHPQFDRFTDVKLGLPSRNTQLRLCKRPLCERAARNQKECRGSLHAPPFISFLRSLAIHNASPGGKLSAADIPSRECLQ